MKDERRPRMCGRVCHETSLLASYRYTCTFIFTAIFFDLDMGFEQNPIWRSINMNAIGGDRRPYSDHIGTKEA